MQNITVKYKLKKWCISMFSIIIPAYNAEPFIKKSIDSVLSQTVDDFEILVVDDGSTDNTSTVVKNISDLRIRYIYQPNGGVSAARNTGIKNAKGDYVCFLDADDLWKPHHLATILKLAEKYPECDVFLTGHEILLNNGETILKKIPGVSDDIQSNNVFRNIWDYGYFICTNSIACKTSAFDLVGLFETGVKNGEDDDMWYRLFAYFSAAVSSEITTTYVRENSRATASKVLIDDWIFLHRVDEIMASSDVTEERKIYLQRVLERRKLSFVRKCILNGDKKRAWKQMCKLKVSLLSPKKYIGTVIALLIPGFISAKAVQSRDKKYYRE